MNNFKKFASTVCTVFTSFLNTTHENSCRLRDVKKMLLLCTRNCDDRCASRPTFTIAHGLWVTPRCTSVTVSKWQRGQMSHGGKRKRCSKRQFQLGPNVNRKLAKQVFREARPEFFHPAPASVPSSPTPAENQVICNKINNKLAETDSPHRCTPHYVSQMAHQQRFRLRQQLGHKCLYDWTDTGTEWVFEASDRSAEWATALGLGPPLD